MLSEPTGDMQERVPATRVMDGAGVCSLWRRELTQSFAAIAGSRRGAEERRQVLLRLLATVRSALAAEGVLFYVPELSDRGWELATCEWSGPQPADHVARIERLVRQAGEGGAAFGSYDPHAVQANQRNRALCSHEIQQLAPDTGSRDAWLCSALGRSHWDQLRVLICQGPRLLAWLGALRERPFTLHDTSILQATVDPLRSYLLQDRAAALSGVQYSLLEGVLDAIRDPALVLSGRGRVEFTNAAALAWLEEDRAARELAELRAAVARRSTHPGFAIRHLPGHGPTDFCIALRRADQSTATTNVARAARLWALSGRESSVLERLAQGNSNKEIACARSCSEVTVERHVTRLLRASGCQSRTELVVRLHQL